MMPSDSQVYREDPIDESHQTSDGNVSPPCDKNNITDDRQLPKCGGKEKKRAPVREIYICSICEKEFRQSGNFHNHMKSHRESLHYCKCGNCGSMFDSDEKLLQHMQKEHTGSNPYKCERCDRKFSQRNNLHRHLRVHRGDIFMCQLCDRIFSETFYLETHMGTHTGYRIYSCGVCTRKFTSNSDLKEHVNTHPMSELHVCDVCNKGFSKACVLRQHKKIHTGKRPYECEQCNKTYIYRHHLKTHMRSHTESKPFACKTCGKEFSQTSHLNKHQRQHLVEAKLSDSSPEESNGREEKVINTLGNNSIPDKLNGVQSNLQQKPKAKPVQKRSRGPRKKAVSTVSSAYLHRAKLSDSSPEESNVRDEKVIITLGDNSIPDELNGEPSNLQQKPKCKLGRKRSRGPRKKAVSNALSAYLHHASQISEANPFPYDFSDPGMVGPLSNEATQNVMKQIMYFPLPGHPTDQNSMYLACTPAFMAAYCMNLCMRNYQSHSGKGSKNCYAQDVSLLNRNPFSYESPRPLSHRDSSPTVNSARNTPVSSASIHKDHNQYFHNSTFAKPVEFLNYNMPIPVNGPCDFPLPTTQRRGNMDFEMRKEMLNSPDLTRSTAMEDRKLENYRKMKVKDEKLDELKEEAYAEEGKQVEDNAFQAEEFSCLKQQIEVREMIQHEIQKETIDAMIDIEEEEEEGRLMIVEQDTEIQAHNSKTSDAEKDEIEKRYSFVCQNEIFSQRMQHDWERNTFRRDTLQRSQIGSICCNKSVVSGECIHGTCEEKAIQQVSAGLRWVNSVGTSRSHSAVETNSQLEVLRPTATLPFQRAVNDRDFNDSSEIVLDMSMKCSPAEHQQIHRKQMGDEKSACPACLAPMDTDSNLFEHLAASMQCYQLYIAKKLHESASSPSEETVLKLAKKYACQEKQDEIYVSQSDLEEPIDLTKPLLR